MLPLWAQVAGDLRRRLAAGEFLHGFPTDRELCDEYDISRHTARVAVRDLREAGMVAREQGRRGSVREMPSEEPLRERYTLAREAPGDDAQRFNDILHCGLDVAGEAGLYLGMPETACVVRVDRRRMYGSEPLALHTSWLPVQVAGALLETNLRDGSFYPLLARHCGVRMTSGWERIRAVVPSAEERHHLNISDGDAAFRAERLAFAGGTPAEFRVSLLRGDHYRFLAEWSPEDSPWTRIQP